jgi:hypothetical protein
MSTLMICPTCGGVKTTATGAAVGRRCSCSTGGGTATATVTAAAAATTASSNVAMKVCSVCGADVTDKKRMKDSVTGRYWCYDCYVAEQRKKSTGGMTMRCPKCGKDYPPVKMMKHGEAYWCEACHESNGKSKKKTQTPAPTAAPSGGIVEVSRKPVREENDAGEEKKKPTLYIIAAILVVAAAAYYYFVMMPAAQ